MDTLEHCSSSGVFWSMPGPQTKCSNRALDMNDPDQLYLSITVAVKVHVIVFVYADYYYYYYYLEYLLCIAL